jgi:hypothetical protein
MFVGIIPQEMFHIRIHHFDSPLKKNYNRQQIYWNTGQTSFKQN